jgi:cellulose synthase/poly-beta-1,6-N-acetylglucosamine synthase-like glycosyltransferase
MTQTLEIVLLVIFLYFLIYNLATLTLLTLSFGETSWLVRGRQPGRSGLRVIAQRPGVSIVVAAHNEEALVVTTATALLDQEYAPLEIVIVDDGSADATFYRLNDAFDLVELPLGGALPLQTEAVRGIYASRTAPLLRVVRKEKGGRSDAVNAGLGVARHELVAVTDADTILEPDAIARALRPFEEHPDDCVAAAGNVRVVNASRVVAGHVVEPEVSWRAVDATQVLEYLRGFLGTRIAWSRMNGLAIVSGGFGVFRRDTLIAVGGLLRDTIGEDLEITLRLHHKLRPGWPTARIAFVPDAVSWTQAPSTLRDLRTQRVRWQIGLIQSLRLHGGMLGRRRFGAVGLLSLPYVALFEAVSMVFELLGYAIVGTLFVLDPSTWPYLAAFVGVSLLFGEAQSMLALLIEESAFRRYGRAGMTRLIGWGLLEILWYRPLLAVWRTWATASALFGKQPQWGTIERREIDAAPGEAVAPLTR